MADPRTKVIDSRLGKREIALDKIIFFPRGIIGFEAQHEFILLEIKEGSPFVLLQSLQDPDLGLLVADPFLFVTNYDVHVGQADKKLLRTAQGEDLTILVTVTIPAGKPQETSLHLTGPIVINYEARLGLQVPQVDRTGPARIRVQTLHVAADASSPSADE